MTREYHLKETPDQSEAWGLVSARRKLTALQPTLARLLGEMRDAVSTGRWGRLPGLARDAIPLLGEAAKHWAEMNDGK